MNPLYYAVIILAGLLVMGFVLTRLYRRATKERAFVRTGMGGEKIILNGGAIILPVFHEVIEVGLNTLKLTVARRNEGAMISKDRLRVNVIADFYVRVKPDASSVSTAAQTLGTKTLSPDNLRELIEAKLIDGLRSVAAGMDMEEMHEKRADFVQKVQQTVSQDLEKNGLELESVSLTDLDQTPLEHFNDSNAFDAVGRAKIIEIVERKKFETNQIQANNRVLIAETDRDATEKELIIRQNVEFAELAQQREVEIKRADQEADIAQRRAEAKRESEAVRIATERDTQRTEIEARRDLEVAEQDRQIMISKKSEEESAARATADEVRARAITAEEGVITAKETAAADRAKKIALIAAEERAEQEAIGVRVQAEADRDAATARAEAKLEEARAESNADKLRAEGIEAIGLAEAKTIEARNDAINKLQPEHLLSQERTTLMGHMSGILEAAGKPIEHIDSLNVMDVSGLGLGATVGAAGNGGGSSGNLADDAVGAALRYRTSAPLIDGLLKQIGIDGSSLNKMVNSAFEPKSITKEEVAETNDVVEEPSAEDPKNAGKNPAAEEPESNRFGDYENNESA